MVGCISPCIDALTPVLPESSDCVLTPDLSHGRRNNQRPRPLPGSLGLPQPICNSVENVCFSNTPGPYCQASSSKGLNPATRFTSSTRWPAARSRSYGPRLLPTSVSYTHLRAHETGRNLVCRLLLEKKKKE